MEERKLTEGQKDTRKVSSNVNWDRISRKIFTIWKLKGTYRVKFEPSC